MRMTRRDSLRLAMVFAASMAVHGQIFPATAANQVTKLSDSELKSDAAIAWRYFANSTSRASKGLVPAAIWPQDGGYGEYGILTMWDVGSIILAYVSARSIGLIDAKEFDERITNVLA
ncbi:MAG TPA: DUF3131 domain-containing protein, partial [Hyphomicrobiaceae bacterium]|nr:DUF3131 domain-containing protein [Hyphomicrobiaceae bacterium]